MAKSFIDGTFPKRIRAFRELGVWNFTTDGAKGDFTQANRAPLLPNLETIQGGLFNNNLYYEPPVVDTRGKHDILKERDTALCGHRTGPQGQYKHPDVKRKTSPKAAFRQRGVNIKSARSPTEGELLDQRSKAHYRKNHRRWEASNVSEKFLCSLMNFFSTHLGGCHKTTGKTNLRPTESIIGSKSKIKIIPGGEIGYDKI